MSSHSYLCGASVQVGDMRRMFIVQGPKGPKVYGEQGTVLERLARVMTYQGSLAGPLPRT